MTPREPATTNRGRRRSNAHTRVGRRRRRPLSGLDKALMALELLLAVGAVPAGLLMIIRPSGSLMSMPLTMLDGSPFQDFLWPGVILLAAIGVLPLVVVWGAWRRRAWAPEGHVAVGAVLIGWIVVEWLMIGYNWLQPVYLGLGIAILGVGIWRWRSGAV